MESEQGTVSNWSVLPAKYRIVGTWISATSYDEVLDLLTRPADERANVFAVCNVHSVMEARRDARLRSALDEATVATPDGMPLVWALRALFVRDQTRVYGPDLMRRALAAAGDLKHYLYGGSESTMSVLKLRLGELFPTAQIVGMHSPPFRGLTDDELLRDIAAISKSDANVVWVGLGMPKQELWMHRAADKLPGVSLLGVGAAFDFLAGKIREAPMWMQRSGLQWLFRLIQEPRRLWRRYLWNNPAFMVLIARQFAATRFSARRGKDVRGDR